MRPPFGLQEIIHKLEEGEGAKYIRNALILLSLFALATLWHLRQAKNFLAVEAMDTGQLARNIAQGHGFTTQFVRPLSISLIEKVRGEGQMALKEGHPDIANAPVYPLLLAGLMKVFPFDWEISSQSRFWRYQPEVIIGWFNQFLFFIAIFQVFLLGRRLFDPAVGWVSAILMALSLQLWEFTTSGLSTMLLFVLFLFLVWLLVNIERGSKEPMRGSAYIVSVSGIAGLVVAIMCLTRYSMGWLIVPVTLFIGFFGVGRRTAAVLLTIVFFLLPLAPWVYRNYSLSKTLLGTAGYAIHHGTANFPQTRFDRLMPRSLQLELNKGDTQDYVRKLVENSGTILTKGIPELGGSWIWAFFLPGLFVPFINPTLSRLRYFLLATFCLLGIAQALGTTELAELSPTFNSENLLILLLPLLMIFGSAFFFLLLDQLDIQIPFLKNGVIGGFALLMGAPLILQLLPPKEFPVTYPPYFPPVIQQISHWLEPKEMMMTDIPWAVAWYGQRQAVWTTLDSGARQSDDFYRINDYGQAIKGLYITPITTDAKYLTDIRLSRQQAWGRFYIDAVIRGNLPGKFPLRTMPASILPDQLFLTDRKRWSE
jgi:hypothetical protein